MIFRARLGQASYGEAIGILLLDTYAPFIPGDVANASTYDFPVRFKKVEGFTTERALKKDNTIFEKLLAASKELEKQGVRAITGDCGFMGIHQQELAKYLDVPVFLTSLLQIPFITSIVGEEDKVGIITADSSNLDKSLLEAAGVRSTKKLVIYGLQERESFYEAIIEETGILDSEKIEKEVVSTARQMITKEPKIKAVLLECSSLPPYGAAVQDAICLPVFDYITMINYVYSAVVKRKFNGFM
jgi:hypothetical protein